jgi:hypothetical protein
LNSFVAEFPEALVGDTLPVRWNITRAANVSTLTIDHGVGDVKAFLDTLSGNGSFSVPVYSNTTYTIAMGFAGNPGHGAFTNTLQVSVKAYTNNTANPGWHLLSRFDNIGATTSGIQGPGGIAGIGWTSPSSDFGGAADQFNVRNLSIPTNFVAGEGGSVPLRPALSILQLNDYTLKVGQSNTLFFRLYVANTNCSPLVFDVGLASKGFFGLASYTGTQVGMAVELSRAAGTDPVDLLAYNRPGGGGGTYSFVTDPVNGNPAGIQKGTVYNVWIDMYAGPVIVDTNSTPPQTNASFYSVWIATNGAPNRIGLFTNFTATSDYINFDPTAGIPGTNYDRLVLNHDTSYTGTNNVLVDDFYISTNGFLSTVPVAASTFNPATPIVISILGGTNLVYDTNAQTFTLNWLDTGCGPYTVWSTNALGAATTNWTPIAIGLTVPTYSDPIVPGGRAFYRITTP